jgi:uncharacterized phage-like protein YoqJ
VIVCATGHRPERLGGYGEEVFLLLTETAKSALRQVEPEHVITGMALGWDMAIAAAAIELGIPFTAAVPFKSQGSRWPPDGKLKYQNLIRYAADIVIVSQGEYAAWKLHKRNEWMVDHSEIVIALFDQSTTTGGTRSCIEYALKNEKAVVNAWENFRANSLGCGAVAPDLVPIDRI